MKHIRIATTLAATSLALGLATATADDNSADKKAPAKESSTTTTSTPESAAADKSKAVVVLVPVVFAMDESLADGCWARLYDSTNYGGNMLALTGPVSVPSSGSGVIAGIELGRGFDSVTVGPKATLNVWDDEQYQNKAATFKPGQKVPDLDAKMGLFENIRSFKVTCAT